MHIGFTGSREMPDEAQIKSIAMILKASKETYENIYFHHGDCVGSDTVAHMIAKKLEYKIILHPPTNRGNRSFLEEECYEVRDKYPYLERNHYIVQESDILIAVPSQDKEVVRSGTWATIRYSKKLEVPRLLIFPEGKLSNQATPFLNAIGLGD